MRFVLGLAVLLLISANTIGCGTQESTTTVHIAIQHRPTAGPTSETAVQAQAATQPPIEVIPTEQTESATAPTDELGQYRLWIEEARQMHPYAESTGQMWDVMLCESSGNPLASAPPYVGLFQYLPATWSGDWNPYRDAAITDPRAQIFATAKAWQDGNQQWWGCYGRS